MQYNVEDTKSIRFALLGVASPYAGAVCILIDCGPMLAGWNLCCSHHLEGSLPGCCSARIPSHLPVLDSSDSMIVRLCSFLSTLFLSGLFSERMAVIKGLAMAPQLSRPKTEGTCVSLKSCNFSTHQMFLKTRETLHVPFRTPLPCHAYIQSINLLAQLNQTPLLPLQDPLLLATCQSLLLTRCGDRWYHPSSFQLSQIQSSRCSIWCYP